MHLLPKICSTFVLLFERKADTMFKSGDKLIKNKQLTF